MIGYAARDKDGLLFFHTTKPERDDKLGGWFSDDFFNVEDDYFPELSTLTYDNSPIKIELKIEII